MKKSLVALAVLAASGAAMAQSSVTLYGVADIWFGSVKSGVGAAETTNTVLNSNGVNSSRWGLKGSEDLGGGLKAVFQLESGFSIDTGAAASTSSVFNRQAFVGLSGGFGDVTFGRQYTAYDALRGATNNTFDTAALTTTGDVFGFGAVGDYASRVDNSISFKSANYGGVSGAFVYGLGEDAAPGVSASNNMSLHVKYAAGPLLVGYAYQVQTPKASGEKTKYNYFAGTYDFGMAKIVAGFNRAELGNAKDNEYQLGAQMPIGAAAAVGIGYVNAKGEVLGTTTSKATGFSLAGYYNLSKRTALYGGFKNLKNENGAGVETNKVSAVAVGVRHFF